MDIICRCGHNYNDHLDDGIFTECLWTYGGKINDYGYTDDCLCMKYVPDNLTYIEALAKEKGLV